MPKFSWEGKTRDGQTKTGVIEASSAGEVEAQLRAMQIVPTKVKKPLSAIEIRLPSFGGPNVKTLVVFTRQLATMIDAGLPLVQCLEILGSQEPDKSFQKTIYGIRAQVEAGATFADALKKYPKIFEALFVSLVAAGEVGGILDTILNRLAAYLEKSMKIKGKVKSAMKYQAFVLIAAFGILGVLLWKVIPAFSGMFKSVGNRELPALTQLVVNMSEGFIKYLPLVLIILVGIIVGTVLVLKKPWGQKGKDWLLLRLPVFGSLTQKAAIARFTRTLGTLVSSGVPILDALEIVARSAGNVIIEQGVMYTRARVAEGKSIAGPLEETKIFPKMVVQMVGVGESTGAMDVMLTKIADFYDDEVDASVEALTSLIEPMMMLVIGGMLGFVLIAMYLQIFGMADNLSGAK